MLDEIINELGSNYNTNDEEVLEQILNRITTNALFISNGNSEENLREEIIECVKSIYLQRGSEDVLSQSQSGLSNQFKDAIAEMRNNIIKNGKRKIK